MYDFSDILLRVWQCLLIAPVTLHRKPADGGAQPQSHHYVFNVWWYAFNLVVLAACLASGVWTVAEDTRAAMAGRSVRIQNTSSAIVTALQVMLQCLVCTLAVACSADRHAMLLDIERHLNRTDAVLRVSAGQPVARYTPALVAFHAALYAVDCYLWYALSPTTWMYCVCYVYMSIDLATMLMYAQIAWSIGRRFEDINVAIEYKLMGIQTNVAAASDRNRHGNGYRPVQHVWTFAGHTAVAVPSNPVAPADCQYDPKNVSIAKLQDLHWSLCNSIKIVNDKFGWQLLLQLFCNCVQLIVTPYFMIINLFYPVIYGSTDIKFILIQVVWVLTHLSHLLLIVLPTSYATRKGEKTAEIICKYLTIDIEPGDIKQLEIFVLQLQKYAIDFSACGIVNLHRSTITTMFHASKALTILWRLTGLGTLSLSSSPPPPSSRLSVVYAATVYSAYAYLCSVLASERLSAYRRHESGTFQVHVIRDTNMALLFVASTTVYWCTAAYRRQHVQVYAEHAAVMRQLFGTAAPVARAMDAYCWVLYAPLVAALSLDVHRYAGPTPWTFGAVYVWGHYVLLTGNMQFAITVFGLRQCYRELNCRMRAGNAGRSHDSVLHEYETAAAKTSSSDVPLQDIMFISVLEKVNLLTILKYWSDVHWSITQIVSRVNNLFKFRLFVFFLCGLLHLMLTPYMLSLTILNEDIDILCYILECTLWFIIHILRVVLMIYPCALLGEEAAKTQILLGSYLNTEIDLFDIKKIETYAQQLAANTPEFSIYSMFIIDKQLVVTLTGAVTTYLVIILQLQGQS